MKLLLVEDDSKLGRAQKELLEIAGFEVTWAKNGKQALEDFEDARQNSFEVVILDWMLPEISGIEICKILRGPKFNYQGGILFVTAKDGLDDCVKGLETGADDYIVKPFQNKELVARINSVNRRKSRPFIDHTYQKNAVTLNYNLLSVTSGNQVLTLSRREFDLFKLLFVNQGQIIPRSTILEKVWADNLEITDSSIDSYIYLLRKKLAKLNVKITIKSVKNIGCLMEVKVND